MPTETIPNAAPADPEGAVSRTDQLFAFADRGTPLTKGQKFLHFWVTVGVGFVRNRCPVRASALAYASLLALVPMLAVIASVAVSLLKNEGEERSKQLIETLVSSLTAQTSFVTVGPVKPATAPVSAEEERTRATRREVVERINEYVTKVRSGALGATGMVALLFMAITMLARIEDTFNDIWGVTRGRGWFARVVQYWAALTLGPLLLMAALALTSSPFFTATTETIAELPWGAGGALMFAFKFLPFLIMGAAFMVFYQLMPNTRVDWRAALVGGAVGGTLWQINNLLSVFYVSRVVTQEKIYGSLGMVPVVMVGLYLSWIILLFGAQVAYVFQNRHAYLQEREVANVTETGREFIALRLMVMVALRFQQGQKAPTSSEIALALAVPSQLTSKIIGALMQGQLLCEVAGVEKAYVPARPLVAITCHEILQALRTGGSQLPGTADGPLRAVVAEEFERIQFAEKQAALATTLDALVRRAADGQRNLKQGT